LSGNAGIQMSSMDLIQSICSVQRGSEASVGKGVVKGEWGYVAERIGRLTHTFFSDDPSEAIGTTSAVPRLARYGSGARRVLRLH
jgi:hypothetical protein